MKNHNIRVNPNLGLLVLGVFLLLAGPLAAQPLKGLKNATDKVSNAGKTVTQPIKDTRSATKEITEPIRDVRQAGKDVTQPVRDVEREVKGLKTDVKRVDSDINQAKQDAERAKNSLRGNGKNDKDDDSGGAQAGGQDSVSAGQPRMRSGNYQEGKDAPGSKTTEKPSGPDIEVEESRSVLLPPNRIPQRDRQPDRFNPNAPGSKASASSGSVRSEGSGAGSAAAGSASSGAGAASAYESRPTRYESGSSGSYKYTSNTPRPVRNYSTSPAGKALERADFNVETLEDLFAAAIWTGPDSAHTARSIDYMLKQFRYDIDEIKQTDPSFETQWYEERYRNWKALYAKETRTRQEE